jgi:hypothetical protein
MTTIDHESVIPITAYQLVPKHRYLADRVRLQSSIFRGFGRTRETDGRKGLMFSTLSPSVLSLIGHIHELPLQHAPDGHRCTEQADHQ